MRVYLVPCEDSYIILSEVKFLLLDDGVFSEVALWVWRVEAGGRHEEGPSTGDDYLHSKH